MTMDFYDARFDRELYEVQPPPLERPTIEEFLLERVAETESYLFATPASMQPVVKQSLILCNAIKMIISWHKNWPVLVEAPAEFETIRNSDEIGYRVTQQIAFLTQEEYRKRFGSEPPTAPLLMQIANLYSDHPDFDPEWKM